MRAALGAHGEIESITINSIGRYSFVTYVEPASRESALLRGDSEASDDGLILNPATPRVPLDKRAIAKAAADASDAARAAVRKQIAAANAAGACDQIAVAKEARMSAQAGCVRECEHNQRARESSCAHMHTA